MVTSRFQMALALILGGALTATAAPTLPTGADPTAGIVVAKAEPSPATEEAFLRLYFPADQLVVSATRHPKPISQIAENVTVITSQEIEDMNAHTVAEVLARVPGLYPEFFGVRFGAILLPHIQGSGETNPYVGGGGSEYHVTVLLDGIPWNSLVTGGPSLGTIPVGIVERIEVIKGPASSTWGSALGGVINVITKGAGTRPVPEVGLSGSYGERKTWDVRGEAAGAAGPLGYYFYGQRQHAAWTPPADGFEGRAAFAKTEARLGGRATLSLAGGYSRPEQAIGPNPEVGIGSADDTFTARFGRAALDADLPGSLSLHLAGYRYDQRQDQETTEDGSWPDTVPGDLAVSSTFDEESHGAEGRLVWSGGRHTLVLGIDYHRGEQDQTNAFGPGYGSPPPERFGGAIDRWGVYVNDTLTLGPLTLNPGLRRDDTSKTDPFLSPSLGVTWWLGGQTLLRAVVSRGFTAPPLAWLAGGGVGLDANPHLKPEQVWSYQGGVETAALRFVWLKASVFRHEVTDALEGVSSSGPTGWTIENRGHVWRTGFEVEGETAPVGGLTLRGSFAFVHVEKSGVERVQDQYASTLSADWTGGPWRAQLAGRYTWWDLGPGARENDYDSYDEPLFDGNLTRHFTFDGAEVDVFTTVHNLFNSDLDDGLTSRRWVEVGARVRF